MTLLAIVACVGMCWATTTVTWNNDDITGTWGTSFTKDGVTITVEDFIDFEHKNFMGGGTFTTTLGNFTKIEVNAEDVFISGEGWSGSTWTGNASSVSFSGEIFGMGMGNTKFVFTIGNAATANPSGSCGENLTWSLNTETGALTISGMGAMTDFESSSSVPWNEYRTAIKSVTLPDGLTNIGNMAFFGCSKLTSADVPASVTHIGDNAFNGCNAMTSVVLHEGLTSLGQYAFAMCYGLTSIDIPTTVTSIANDAFYSCTGLTSVVIPDGITSIEERTFGSCYELTSVTIPASVTSIGARAFSGDSKLASIDIPAGVTSIGDFSFYNCTSLTSVTNNATTP